MYYSENLFEKNMEEVKRLYYDGEISIDEVSDRLYAECKEAWKRSLKQAWNLQDAQYLYKLETDFTVTVEGHSLLTNSVRAYATIEEYKEFYRDLDIEYTAVKELNTK